MVDGVFVCVCFVRRICFLFNMCLCVVCVSYNVTLSVCSAGVRLLFAFVRFSCVIACVVYDLLCGGVWCVCFLGGCVFCCCLYVSVCEWVVQCVCLCCL